MRGGEPRVLDRLEGRTPISCEWAEKEHTGRRAEPKAEGYAPKPPLARRFGAAQLPKQVCVPNGVPWSLPLSLSEHLVVVSVVSNTELECPSEIPFIAGGCPYLRERFNHTNHLCRSFRTNRGLRPPAFRLPREGRQLPGSRGAFHRLESMCTGLAPTAFIDRSSDHADALLIGYPFP